jgi:hypothetical protein
MSQKLPKKPQANTNPEDHQLERTVHDAMLLRGWLIPTSEEQVLRAESELADHSVELPKELEDPACVLDAIADCVQEPRLRLPVNREAAENLARAAREGGEIPPEIEERMRVDREKAEREIGRQA